MLTEKQKDHLYSGNAIYSDPTLPNLKEDYFNLPNHEKLGVPEDALKVKPRFLIIYGSLREVSYSRLVAEEAARILIKLGAEVKFFDPRDLPMPQEGYKIGGEADPHPKIKELIDLALWADGHVWSSPERHGSMSAVFKTQIDHIPLSFGSVRPTQGRTLAILQVAGGSQSFNTVNNMRILGRWMRMLVIPNQSSVPRAYTEFDDETGRMKSSALYNRVVDVMEELMKFTLLTRDKKDYLVDRYSERCDNE
ncbi:arsenical resistance protein ArsH [Hyphomicrobiales bacterium 4NK60-0047b]